jgi:glycosyltransferase involved in cell wall biosynthesis
MNNEITGKIIPLVSVVMPVWNAEKFLDSAILSVLEQTLADFEFIIIDDASTDKSVEIASKWQAKDKRIIFLRNEEHKGITASINRGLKIAHGRYIARMDADDVCLPSRLAEQVKFLDNNPDVFLAGTFVLEIDENGQEIGRIEKGTNPESIKEKIFYYSPCVHPSIMFRRELITKIGLYDEAYPFCQDQDLYLRMIFSGYAISNVPLFLLRYRRHPGSVDRNRRLRASISLKIKKAVIKKFGLQVSFSQALFFYAYYMIEAYFPLKLRYRLEALGRKMLLRQL